MYDLNIAKFENIEIFRVLFKLMHIIILWILLYTVHVASFLIRHCLASHINTSTNITSVGQESLLSGYMIYQNCACGNYCKFYQLFNGA